ncbi:uncharacterized protein LOC102800959 [Saccoglossus kowalevskii]|uniref:Branched-chain-amino-acid aminotransferase-like protein 2-like n=1 Tax=Saccoglossus kowalevskii TaxID=10224 RepID=A0ABM0M7X0_SACKO|nr:PREDICTED: branched-chain-amino-acid aminotransferase-like protein 2-like [Saccoglossus kowalevskii]
MSTTDNPRRIMLWAYPRSLSTVLEFSVAALDNVKMFHELYNLVFHNGEDRPLEREKAFFVEGHTYKSVKQKLENDYPGKSAIFCKDIAYTLDNDYSRLPRDYRHTFIIRDPRRTIPSYYKATIGCGIQFDEWLPSSGGVKQLYDLFVYVTEMLGQEAIIIDAYDLCNNPRQILQKYCKKVGLQFQDKMLNWEPGNNDHWHKLFSQSFFTEAFKGAAIRSREFLPMSYETVDLEGLPDYGVKQIEEAMPYYELLYDKRIIPE